MTDMSYENLFRNSPRYTVTLYVTLIFFVRNKDQIYC